MKYFTKHLDSVGESYFQHLRHASSFAAHMIVGSLACLGHAIFPFLFERTGSDAIRRLHERMVVNRHQLTPTARPSVVSDGVAAER